MKNLVSYQTDKTEVLNFFDNYVLKYVVKDLEKLNRIKADKLGVGGCAIPQASSTFSALDLISYLVHPQEERTVKMSFTNLLKNPKYFTEFNSFMVHGDFFESFKDNARGIMVHRFVLAQYDITKSRDNNLFTEKDGRQIFNTAHFTKITIKVIKKIYAEINDDKLNINGKTKELTMETIKKRIQDLKDYKQNFVPITGLPVSTVTTETTKSLG